MNNPHVIRAYDIGTAPTLLDDIRLEVYTCRSLLVPKNPTCILAEMMKL